SLTAIQSSSLSFQALSEASPNTSDCPSPNTQKKNMGLSVTAEPVVFLFFATMHLEMSAVQDLINTKCCFSLLNTTNLTLCHSAQNETRTAIKTAASPWIAYYYGLLSVLTLICGMWVGSWNDRFGRKRPMLFPLVGGMAAVLNFIVLSHFLDSHVSFVMISAVLVGLSTGSLGVVSSCFGYLTDVVPLSARSRRIAILEAMVFTGGACGMYLVGGMLKSTTYEAIFLVELVIYAVAVFYVLIAIKEKSGVQEGGDPAGRPGLFTFRHVVDMALTVCRARDNGHRRHILLLLLAATAMFYGLAAQIYLTYTFLTDEPLRWDATHYSFFQGVNIALEGAALLVVLPLSYRFLGMSDPLAGLLGSLSRGLGLLYLGLCSTSTMVYFTPVFLVFSEFATPSIRSMLSKIVAADEKGKAFAMMSALQSFALFTGSLLFNGLYPATSKFFKGFGFEFAAALQLISIVIFG
ncbi:adenylate cyclase, putative, partial [Ixodes scapularis]